MITRTTVAAVVALAGISSATVAEARPAAPRAVTATWHPDMGAEGRYCIRASHLETAAMTGTRIYQRACRTERAWREMGVTFARASRRS